MQTECTPDFFSFEPVEGRSVVAAFDGGAVSSDAGALLLGQTDWTLLTKVEASCDRILIAGGANVEAEWEQGPAV